MKERIAPVSFGITFAIGAALAGIWTQASAGYITAYCIGGAVGGAICGYLLSDRRRVE